MFLNKVILIGNLTRAPELRYTPNGTAVTDLRLAVNRTYTAADGEKKEEVLFIGVVCWSKTAEASAEHLDKGSKVIVEGRLTSRDWEAKGGGKRTTIEVVAENVKFLSFKDKGGKREPVEERQTGRAPAADDEVPF